MAQVKFISLLMLLTMLPCSFAVRSRKGKDYVEEACSVTRYRYICIRSLSPFSSTAKRNPSIWARAGVSVTIKEAKRVSGYLKTIEARGRSRIALSDCVECFQDTLDELHKSLGVLRKLSAREFGSQLEDVTTWISAALTVEDTCLDGFGHRNGTRLVDRVNAVSYLTSNALALVNKLSTAGPQSLTNSN